MGSLKTFLKRNRLKYLLPTKQPVRGLMEPHGSDRKKFTKIWQMLMVAHPRPHIICRDGFSFSAQGGAGLYSIPDRESLHYTAMEIGYPSHPEPLMGYMYNIFHRQDVQERVPAKTIKAVIRKHGGIDWKAMKKAKAKRKLSRLKWTQQNSQKEMSQAIKTYNDMLSTVDQF